MVNHYNNKQIHQTLFKQTVEHIFFAPGRVNIIGEHIDYNGGNVLPIGIDLGTYAYVSVRSDDLICLASNNVDNIYTSNITSLDYVDKSWSAYIIGSFKVLQNHGINIPKGLNILIDSTLPLGSGLSSSASLEVLSIYIIEAIFNLNLDPLTRAKYAQEAEITYNHVSCGIMDQAAISLAKEGYALLLNTNTLAYEKIPFNIDGYKLCILSTNKKRSLNESKYNERVTECNTVLHLLQQITYKPYLCDYTLDELNFIKPQLTNTLYQRCYHVITEQNRVLSLIKALKLKDLNEIAKLLNSSHNSLKNAYEVTGYHLDIMQELAIKHHAIGARMTGAGFGGCVIALVKDELIESFTNKIIEDYTKLTSITPHVYVVTSSSKPKELANDFI